MTTHSFYRKVIGEIDRVSAETAARGTAAVFHALRDRLTPEEADQLVAQLPRELQTLWEMGEKADRRPLKMHREAFYDRVRKEAGLASIGEARVITLMVFAALKEQISPGEAEHVLTQLPKDLKEVWLAAS